MQGTSTLHLHGFESKSDQLLRGGALKLISLLAIIVFGATRAGVTCAADIPPFCDEEIMNRPGDAFGYRLRGDRCEGRYEQPTGAVPQDLTVISLACPNPQFSLGSSKPTVAWSRADGSPVSIRIETLPQYRLRYRLDTASSDPKDHYSWDGDTWRALSIDPSELGIVIKGQPKIGGNVFHGTLLQARLGTDASLPACPAGPTLEVRTGQRLSALKVCATALTADGDVVGQPNCQAITGSFFPSKSIRVPLGVLRSATHLVEITLEGTPPGPSAPPRYFRVKVD